MDWNGWADGSILLWRILIAGMIVVVMVRLEEHGHRARVQERDLSRLNEQWSRKHEELENRIEERTHPDRVADITLARIRREWEMRPIVVDEQGGTTSERGDDPGRHD